MRSDLSSFIIVPAADRYITCFSFANKVTQSVCGHPAAIVSKIKKKRFVLLHKKKKNKKKKKKKGPTSFSLFTQ
jgi:hypothetical protein